MKHTDEYSATSPRALAPRLHAWPEQGRRPAGAAARQAVHVAPEMQSAVLATDRSGVGLSLSGRSREFARGHEIFRDGADAEFFFMVQSGVVRTCKFLRDGRRQVGSFHAAGDVFGLEVGVKHTASAVAVCDCAVVSYRRASLESSAQHNGELTLQLLSHTMRNLERTQRHSTLLACGTAMERVASFLVDCSEQSPNAEFVTLEMTREDIADYLGLTIETISRSLLELERAGLIDRPTARRVRLVDPVRLRQLGS